MTSNQINYFKAREEQRTNLANEDIKRDSNVIARGNLFVNQRQADAAERNAATNALNAQLRGYELAEAQRANMAREAETTRSNMAREYETMRSNQASESIQSWYNQQRISQGEGQLYQQSAQRHTDEYIAEQRLIEENRHNVAMEGAQKAGVIAKGIEIIGKFLPAVIGLA
jgi:hypothetical protein